MKRNSKFRFCDFLCLTVLCVLMFTFCARATEVYFYQYVDSNVWTYTATATKQNSMDYAELWVIDLLKADGSPSNYLLIKAKATSGGAASFIPKGNYYKVPIPTAYQSPGSNVTLYLMGANPALDCIAYGYWDVH